jgi:hypothetical protein
MYNSDGTPVCASLTPASYTDGTCRVGVSGITDVPTLGRYSTIACTCNGITATYTNSGAPTAPLSLLVPGWMQSTPGNQGVQVAGPGMFTTGQTTFLYVNGPGFGGPAGGNVIYQDLGSAASVLAPNSKYTFQVDVGARGDSNYPLDTPIVAGVFVGAPPGVVYTAGSGATDWTLPDELSLLSENNVVLPDPGAFVTWTKVYETGASIPAGDVYVVLGTLPDAPVTGDQVDFTNVSLEDGAIAVPEPSDLALVGLAAATLLVYSSCLSGWAKSAKALAGMLTVSHFTLRGFRCVR